MRPEKANIVADLSEKLTRSPFVLVTDYQRMKVDQFGELRNRLAPAGAEVHVVKNSFLKRAMTSSGMPDVADKLMGQTAIVTGANDVAPVAKILKMFSAEFKIATLKVGVVDKAILSTAEVEALAELPAREILLAQLLGLFLAPATRLVRVLNEPAAAFARLMKAKGETMKTQGGDTKAEGGDTKTEGGDTKAEGGDTKAEGGDTKAEGGDTKAEAGDIKAEAGDTRAEGSDTRAEGEETKPEGAKVDEEAPKPEENAG